jgi:hypothetical protein
MSWTKINEGLPTESGWYMVVQHGRIQICPFEVQDGYWRENGITHWMPLPAMPIKTTSQEGCQEAETRATFIVSEVTLERIKALAYWNRMKIKDIVNEALRDYLNPYEAKNGPIQPKPGKRS